MDCLSISEIRKKIKKFSRNSLFRVCHLFHNFAIPQKKNWMESSKNCIYHMIEHIRKLDNISDYCQVIRERPWLDW